MDYFHASHPPDRYLATLVIPALRIGNNKLLNRFVQEVKKAVADDPTAIGYIDKSAVHDTVKVILTLQ